VRLPISDARQPVEAGESFIVEYCDTRDELDQPCDEQKSDTGLEATHD
jgi:hypothetical protein